MRRRIASARDRAAMSVAVITGLPIEQARIVVETGEHDLYDEATAGMIDPEETLGNEVRAVIADHMETGTSAEAINVAVLMEAVDAGWLEAWGNTIKILMPDGYPALTGDDSWSLLEVQKRTDEGPFLPVDTGLANGCPDPLQVAERLTEIAPHWFPRR